MNLTSSSRNPSFDDPGAEDLDLGAPGEPVRYWEPLPHRMRAVCDGETVLDSRRGMMVWESGGAPAFYFPLDDVRAEWCEDERITLPPDAAELLPGHVAIDYTAIDRWFEEDDPINARSRARAVISSARGESATGQLAA